MQYERSRPPPRPKPGDAWLRQYRLYFLGGDGHITHSHEYEAADDDKAIAIAQAWLEGRRAELWAGPRRVKSWDADPRRFY